MSASPYLRAIPYGESQLEDLVLQYIPSHRQLVITFYYQSIQFAFFCSKVDDRLVPFRVVNHLKKDDNNLRARFLVSVLNDKLEDLFAAIAGAHSSFETYVRREIGTVHYA